MICLDTNCVIYLIEANPVWGPKIAERLASLRKMGEAIAVSDLVRTECLAYPYSRGDSGLIADYQTFFESDQVRMLPLTIAVCERAAQIRAASSFRLKVPDCLHLAAAVEAGCSLFLTNDQQLSQYHGVPVEILE
jgi:predicted nucleic acid-binding protein